MRAPTRIRILFTLFVLLVMLSLASCSGLVQEESSGPGANRLDTFYAIIDSTQNGTVIIDFGFYVPTGDYPYEEPINAYWRLWGSEGSFIAHGFTEHVPHIPGGSANEKLLDNWQGQLTPGKYKIEWGAPDHNAIVVEFEVTTRGSRTVIADQKIIHFSEFPPEH